MSVDYEDLDPEVREQIEALSDHLDEITRMSRRATREYDRAEDGSVNKAKATDWLSKISDERLKTEARIEALYEQHDIA